MRKLSYNPQVEGFFDGVSRGVAAASDVYAREVLSLPRARLDGRQLDRDALRGDIERAKEKFRRQIGG